MAIEYRAQGKMADPPSIALMLAREGLVLGLHKKSLASSKMDLSEIDKSA